MKYLCCSHSSWLGGAELAFVELLKCLSERGRLTISVPMLNGDLIPMIQNEGINTIVEHQWPLWMMQDTFTLKRKLKCILRIIKGVRECIKFLRKEQPDMVIVNTISSPVPLIASKLLNIPAIVYIHENGGFGVYNFLFSEKYIYCLLGKLSTKLICNSQYTYDIYHKYINPYKLTVIYQPIEISPMSPRKHQGYVVGSVGITSTQKNFQLLMDAMRTIPDIQLKIAGFNNNECGAYLKEYATKIGLGDRVEWLGVIDDMPDFYSRIDVLVACGKQEALGRSVIEAMKCGVPVIAMRDGGYVELIGEGERGWLFEKDNVADLKNKILQSETYDWSNTLDKAEQFANIAFSEETFSKEIEKLLN